MKCKLSKLFFLALVGAISVKGYSQTEAERKKITEGYDLNYLSQLSKDFSEKYQVNYAKALEVVKDRNLPISGVNESGSYFSLKGIDEETGDILYYQTSNNGTTNSSVQTARTANLYQGGSLGINVQGQGMIVGIWDGGQPQAGHENLGVSRVTNKDGQYVTSNDPDRSQRGIDHATHVSGTMMGNGSGNIRARGLAFNAYLWSNTWDNDNAEMVTQAAQGLLVSNHSYGIDNSIYVDNPGIFGRYTSESRGIDVITFNADKYLPVIAAGNDRNGIYVNGSTVYLNSGKSGSDLLTHEAVAKNPVVVAAVEGITEYTSTSASSNNVVMSDFSQWGPTDDFRVKPDISAKGVAVFSSNMPSANSINSYASYPGTSMAAPAVSAVFTLWQQYHNSLWPTKGYMKAATVKALMAHTASEAGSAEGPDGKFGWGLINAEGGAQVLKSAKANTAVVKELVLENGSEYTLNVVLDGSSPLTATIAWTDKESAPVGSTDSTASLLVNDLDLRVVRPNGVEVLPWALNKSFASQFAGRMDNNVDPIEKVTYYGAASGVAGAGDYVVKVKHKGALNGGSQKFSIIVSGGVVSFNDTVGVEKFVFDDLKIYPNPANDVINLSSDFASIENAKISIFDILGKKVYSNDALFESVGDASIDISNLKTGVYMVEILKDNKIETRKIIKK